MKPTPSLNVNFQQCDCGGMRTYGCTSVLHDPNCAGLSVNIPCPIPDSFTCSVVLGECTSPHMCKAFRPGGHVLSCPGSPVRVSCSITSDGTWAGSEVKDIEWRRSIDGSDWLFQWPSGASTSEAPGWEVVLAACRARWALAKTVLLGAQSAPISDVPWATWEALHQQRDAVFSAIAKRARAEDDGDEAAAEFFEEVPASVQVRVGRKIQPRLSEEMLAAYVEHLVEQVGALS